VPTRHSTADAADAAIHRASMGIQSRRSERQKLSAQQELWCVLKDNLLLLYSTPSVRFREARRATLNHSLHLKLCLFFV
jgi:hypothetical protein